MFVLVFSFSTDRSRSTPPPGAKHNLTEHVDLEAERSSLMATTNQLTFAGRAEKRPDARPTSNTRKNNPQPKSFRSTQLPSGRTINVSLHSDADGRGGLPLGTRSLDLDDGFHADSTFRQSFRAPSTEGSERGNVTRYGQNLQPWSNSFRASRGIVPTINALDLDVTARTVPTNSDAYASGLSFTNRFSATTSRRAPAEFGPEDHENLTRVVEADALDFVESWVRSAPGFEGEVVKRMLRDVAKGLAEKERREAAEGGATNAADSSMADFAAEFADGANLAHNHNNHHHNHQQKEGTSTSTSTSPASVSKASSRTHDASVVSKWGGPVTNVV